MNNKYVFFLLKEVKQDALHLYKVSYIYIFYSVVEVLRITLFFFLHIHVLRMY